MLPVVAEPLTAIGDFVRAGGWVLPWIVATALVMWTLILERWWYFRSIYPEQRRAFCSEWLAREDHRSWGARKIRAMMISQATVGMGASLPILKVTITISPLLGLLGTVTGMLEVFDGMTLRGSADARSMAEGVSHAMVATMAGLGVSISGMFFIGRFQSRVRHESELLADALTY